MKNNSTQNHQYKLIRGAFDTIEVSFKAAMPGSLLSRLEVGRAEAQQARAEALVNLAPGVSVHVAETGMRGGYRYRFDTGPEGATWMVKHSEKVDWNMRASVKAAALAKLGYEGVKKQLYDFMQAVGVTPETESVGRADFAIDFATPEGFEIDPQLIVAHACAKSRENYGKSEAEEVETEKECIVRRGRVVETLTVGQMPGRQVTVYNKTREVEVKKKGWWWDVWGLPKGTQVYRLEVRIGKKAMKERLGITTWQEFEDGINEAIAATLQSVRMRDPESVETNISRTGYHPMWQAALQLVRERFKDVWAGCEPVRILRHLRKQQVEVLEQQIKGLAVSYASVCQLKREEWKQFVGAVAKRLIDLPRKDARNFDKKWQKADNKYAFLSGQLSGYEAHA